MTNTLTRGTRRWMAVSGLVGFAFFLACNFYLKQVVEWRTLTALGQIAANTFVFVTWRRGYQQTAGRLRTVCLIGATVPVVMATITLIRVLIPILIRTLP